MTGMARVLGRTFGFFGRIGLPRPRLGAKGARKRDALVLRERSGHAQLQAEIERTERELDSVYALVVKGAGSVSRNGAEGGSPELGVLLEKSRDLKQRLQEKRAELSRIQRDAAREKRLGRNVSLESSLREERRRPAATPRAGPAGRGQAVPDPGRRKALQRAARNVSLGDGSQQVIFEKAMQDLLENDAEIRRGAVVRLGELRHPSLVVVLAEALEDTNDNVVAAALNSLALLGTDAAEPLFHRFTSHPDHHLRLASLRGLAKIETWTAGKTMLVALQDENAPVRKGAATYLGWRREKQAVRGLMQALRDEHDEVRAAAAGSLGNIRDERAVLSLIRSLSDPSAGVREAARSALEMLLEKKLDLDIQSRPDAFDPRLEELKQWWKQARIDRQLLGDVPLPDLGEIAAAAPVPSEPEPAPGPEPPPVEDSEKVVDLRAAAAAAGRAARVIKLAQRPEEPGAGSVPADRREAEAGKKAPEPAGPMVSRPVEENKQSEAGEELSGLDIKAAAISEPPMEVEQGEAEEELAGLGAVAPQPSEPAAGLDADEVPEELAGLGAVAASGDEGESGEAGSLLGDAELDAESVGLGDLGIKIGGGDDGALEGPAVGEADSAAGWLDDEDDEDAQYESLLGEDFSISNSSKQAGSKPAPEKKKNG
jgi:HEAT repeat protein